MQITEQSKITERELNNRLSDFLDRKETVEAMAILGNERLLKGANIDNFISSRTCSDEERAKLRDQFEPTEALIALAPLTSDFGTHEILALGSNGFRVMTFNQYESNNYPDEPRFYTRLKGVRDAESGDLLKFRNLLNQQDKWSKALNRGSDSIRHDSPILSDDLTERLNGLEDSWSAGVQQLLSLRLNQPRCITSSGVYQYEPQVQPGRVIVELQEQDSRLIKDNIVTRVGKAVINQAKRIEMQKKKVRQLLRDIGEVRSDKSSIDCAHNSFENPLPLHEDKERIALLKQKSGDFLVYRNFVQTDWTHNIDHDYFDGTYRSIVEPDGTLKRQSHVFESHGKDPVEKSGDEIGVRHYRFLIRQLNTLLSSIKRDPYKGDFDGGYHDNLRSLGITARGIEALTTTQNAKD